MEFVDPHDAPTVDRPTKKRVPIPQPGMRKIIGLGQNDAYTLGAVKLL